MSAAASVRHLLSTLLRSPVFLLTCVLSLGLTIVRESFNLWIPTYFTQALGMSPARAAVQQELPFNLVGTLAYIGNKGTDVLTT